MSIFRLIPLRPKLTVNVHCGRIAVIAQPRVLGALVQSKVFWFVGMAALVLTLAACSSSDPTAPPTAPAPTGTAPSITKVATATPAPTPISAPPTEDGDGQAALSTPPPDLPDDPTLLMRATLEGNIAAIARKMVARENLSYIPVPLEFMRFQAGGEPTFVMASFLNKLVEGPDTLIIPRERTNWDWWIEWLGQDPQIQPPEGYAAWKGELYSVIDPGLGSFLYEGVKSDIRLEEVVWGGVAKDGIPDLINPPAVSASEADYLQPDDLVFGVSINGEHKAYSLRILNFHEMANDVVGGVPFALAY